MSVEILLISYFAWSGFAGLVCSCIQCRNVMSFIGGMLGYLGFACVGPPAIAGPLALFLLVDGEWCSGDCWLISSILFPVSFMLFIAAAGSAEGEREAIQLERECAERRRARSEGSGHEGSHLGWAAVLLLMLAIASPAGAQFTEADAEAVAREAGEVLRDADWQAYAELLHPDDLAAFAGFIKAMAAQDPSGEAGEVFFGGLSTGGIGKLSDADVLERLFDSIAEWEPEFRRMLSSIRFEIIGSVIEGEQFFVVQRVHFDMADVSIWSMEIATVKPYGEELRVGLNADIQQFAQGVVASLQ